MKPLHVILAVIMSLAMLPLMQAQSVMSNGTPNFGSFSGGPDVINDSVLNIHYDVPVFGRNGVGLPFSYSISVDNGVWFKYQDVYLNYHWGMDPSTAQAPGVMAIGGVFYTTTGLTCARDGELYNKFTATSYTDPDNTSHQFQVVVYDYNCTGHQPSTATGMSTDGSGATLTFSGPGNATVTLRNGTIMTVPTIDSLRNFHGTGNYSIQDTNQNKIWVEAVANSQQLSYILDTLGTQPITVSGGPPPATVTYSYPAPSGQASVTVSYKTSTVQSAWGCSGIAEFPATSKSLIDKVTLADGTYYEFFYEPTTSGSGNVTGRINQVHLPTGGTISYSYSGGDTGKGIVCADGTTAGFSRVSSQSGTVQYSRTVSVNQDGWVSSSTTTMTDNSGNVTTATFVPSAPQPTETLYEVGRSVYQGAASGTPLESVTICYGLTGAQTASSCQSGGFVSLNRKTAFHNLNGGPYSESDIYYNNYGLVTTQDIYDWGASTYTQETQTTYDTTLGDGIVDRPSRVKVINSTGTKAETDYSYDDFAIQGDTLTCSPAAKCRGNLTKLTKYAASSTTFTTKMTYNLNGTLATSVDPNGIATTTFTYGSGACGPLPSQTKVTAGSITLATSDTYYCPGTVRKSHTDANNQVTSASFTDPYFWRPYSTTDELNNATYYTYTGQTVAEKAMTFNANRSTIDALSTRDSFGRPAYSQQRQGVGSNFFDSVQQVYDSTGRPYETSMRYQGAAGSPPTSGIYAQTSYDAMMRTTQATDAGGGTVNKTYTKNDVYQEIAPAPSGSSENTKRKQLEYDGLSRLTSVCEITADPTYGGTCGQATGGYSGYLSQYVYDTAGVNSLTVNQNAQPNGGTAQQRVYMYDMLGRITYESNPETKVTNYYYDSLTGDANCGTVSFPGDLVKSVDQKGVVACFAYDVLHRLTSINYSSGPGKFFVYDSATLSGVTFTNTMGRLAEAYTCTGSCTPKTTDIFFSYSARGEVTDTYESTPHSSGYNHVVANYWPHGILWSLAIPNISILPTIYYGAIDGSGLDGEGRVTKVTTGAGATLANPVTYTTSGTTQPIGSLTAVTYGSTDTDTFGYDTLTGRLTNYSFNMNSSAAKSGALTWNANGSLKQLALTDNLNTGNSQTCSYSHDDLARAASVNCVKNSTTVWNQSFSFDPFGNITKNATAGVTFTPTYNMATNRYSSLPGCTPTYDGDGHLTNDCSHTYTWQGDGSVSKIDSITLTNDALGRVVEQKNGSTYTQIIYSPAGGKLGLLNGSTVVKVFVPLPGGGTAVYGSTGLAYYRHADWLGSSRLASTPTAPTSQYFDAEYAPYGEPYGAYGTPDFDFTGQNQDTASGTVANPDSGLYDFLFREYNPQHGRWVSPDPAGMGAVSLESPQSWNRYAYVGNMPLESVDPAGLFHMMKNGVEQDANPYLWGLTRTAGLLARFEFFSSKKLDDIYFRWKNGDIVATFFIPVNSPWQSVGSFPLFDTFSFGGSITVTTYTFTQPQTGGVAAPKSANTVTISAAHPQPKPSCTGPGIWAGVKAAAGDFFTPPGADPLGDVGDALRDENVQRAAVGTLYVAANSARALAPALDVAADFIPVVGEVFLAYQVGHALYEGGMAYQESIDQCHDMP